MMFCRSSLVAALLATLAPVTTIRAANADTAPGRALVSRYADAIVGIELVVMLRIKMGDRGEAPPREQRIEVNGTMISKDGLTVTTLAAVDQQATMEAMRGGGSGGRGPEIVGSEFKEVKLRLADGREVPARFVLKDADLDLAFMAPETPDPAREYPHVKLEDSVEGALLDDFYFIARAPKTLQRVPLVRKIQVMGVVERPRRFYLMSEQAPGSPVFDPQGRVLGVTLQYFANGGRAGFVVLPAADIAEMAKQAAATMAK